METTTPTSFTFKLSETCNIACKYCYVFEFDKSISRERPAILSAEILDTALEKIAEYLKAEGQEQVSIGLHGGEPLVIGKKRFRAYVSRTREVLGFCRPHISLQTNGVLLDTEWLDLFLDYDIHFGISLDGPPVINDEYRVTKSGIGTSKRVLKAIDAAMMHPARRLFDIVLCTVNPAAAGDAVYNYLCSLGIKRMDFLIPDGNHLRPPFHISGTDGRTVGDFMVEAFDAWFAMDDNAVKVRTFRIIIAALLGVRPRLDMFGNVDGSLAFIETDGSMLSNDVLRTCGPPYDRAVLNILSDDIRSLKDERLFPWKEPATACKQCDIFDICGGGYAPHRFDGRSFQNPSFYCEDMQRLIRHIAGKVIRAIPPERRVEYPLLHRALSESGRQASLLN